MQSDNKRTNSVRDVESDYKLVSSPGQYSRIRRCPKVDGINHHEHNSPTIVASLVTYGSKHFITIYSSAQCRKHIGLLLCKAYSILTYEHQDMCTADWKSGRGREPTKKYLVGFPKSKG